jgi:uncharacterized protein with HEPN domain
MKNSDVRLLHEILERVDNISETLFGYAYADFRTNRKLKIEITHYLYELVELVETSTPILREYLGDEKFDDVENIKYKIISQESGISEEYIWKVCKKGLPVFSRELKKLIINAQE